MLALPNRLRDRRDITRVRKFGKSFKATNLELKFITNNQQLTRVTVVVSTKISKKATVRNTIRRRVIGVIQELWAQLPTGIDLLFVARTDCSKLAPAQMRDEVVTILGSAGIPIATT